MDKVYSTRIIVYLTTLGQFDTSKIKEMELELIQALKDAGLSEHRYRRYKTDRTGETPLLHQEAETIFKFFQNRFDAMMKDTDDSRYRKTLEAWYPNTTMDLYWQNMPQTA